MDLRKEFTTVNLGRTSGLFGCGTEAETITSLPVLAKLLICILVKRRFSERCRSSVMSSHTVHTVYSMNHRKLWSTLEILYRLYYIDWSSPYQPCSIILIDSDRITKQSVLDVSIEETHPYQLQRMVEYLGCKLAPYINRGDQSRNDL